ncbi:MAG TPA: ABC transporter permease [Anaerolineales bacterium]|nr:ABC transporter permease [Anaerolineales bacterium]
MSELTVTASIESELLPERGAGWGARVRRYAPTAIVLVLGLVLWETAVAVFNIENFLLPRPSVIAQTFWQEAPIAFRASLFTMLNAVGGFALGCALGIGVALATARWTVVSEGMLPFAIAVNATPIVALAPIMNQWFGVTDPLSKMSIVAVMVFFPVMINTVRGLTVVEASALEMMRSYAASEFAILLNVRIPNALPYLFGAFKVSSTLSIIGAIVSEYFGGLGPKDALGAYISQQASDFRFASAWAAIIVACLAGIAFYAVILFVERLVMPWHVSMRVTDE